MKLLKSETAAATIVGQVIILAISIIGISTVLLYGVPAIYSLENLANVKNVEQSLTVLDSRASRAILGESLLQVNNINLGGGTLAVEPNSTGKESYIVVKSSSFNITIPMGKVKYQLGDRIVAYEGGGVWSKYPSGGSVMLSPPEFHYNGVTLSLPAINISGSTSVSGKGTATISFKKNPAVVLFPTNSITQTTQTVQIPYKWTFDNNNESWMPSYSGDPVTMGFNATDGNTLGSIFAKLAGSSKSAMTEWISPNFTWTNGTPSSARLDFDWRATSTNYFYVGFEVILVNGDTSSSLYASNNPVGTPWSTTNITVSNNNFSQSGNYRLKLKANLLTGPGSSTTEVRWDNPTITLNYTGTVNVVDTNMTNPVNLSNGKVYVNITSDFYDAWADYAKSLGYAKVSTDPKNSTTILELSVVPNNLGTDIPIANPVVFRGLNENEDTPLDNFSFWLKPFGNEFDWDIRASSGKKRLIFYIKTNAGQDVDLNIGYEDDGQGYTKPAETWAGDKVLIVQESGGQAYLAVDFLNTSLNLTYKKKTIGAEASCSPDKIKDGKFNDTKVNNIYTGFSWPFSTQTIEQTAQYKWFFATSNESWKSSNTTTTGTVTMSNTSTDGNSSGSIYSKLIGSNKITTTTWTSPNITWNNGTPTSARLDFDWKVATYGRQGNFSVLLVKTDSSTSQIYNNTFSGTTTGWQAINSTISANSFIPNGNYSLRLIATLNTSDVFGGTTEEVRWDNPTITLNYTGSSSGASQLTNKSLYDITQHYFEIMAIDGDGTITFYQCAPSGKQAPASDSTMLMDYITPGGLTYLQISENRVDAGVS